MAVFRIEDLSFTYPNREIPALREINFSIEYGEFAVICGKSGCGKSSLLRHLKTALTPQGERRGKVLFYGRPLHIVSQREQTGRIGYVLQNPDNQIVTDKVWHELAFGLESLGMDKETIRLRVSEMASFFGIQEWFMKDVSKLSGGQKQLLNLASVMTMQPDILILDEPTAQLDPISAGSFLETVKKINREIGTTVIITEQRLEDVLPMADRVLVMDGGRIIIDEAPADACALLARMGHEMFMAMPSPLQAYAMLYEEGIGRRLSCPLNVREGRTWLTRLLSGKELTVTALPEKRERNYKGETPIIEVKDLWFRYGREDKDVVKDLSLSVYPGELFCIVGGNGTGKTTALTLISGINRAYRGTIKIEGRDIGKYGRNELFSGLLGVLPQNPQALFVENTVEKDLWEVFEERSFLGKGNKEKEENRARIFEAAELTEIKDLMDSHPYDLSGGEQQRAALAKVLLMNPRILLLDEPTKGLDNHFKAKLAEIFNKLKEKGVTIVMVSHDVEFCGRYGDRCAMFFDGNITAVNTPTRFFSGNNFYTTAANRMSRHIFENAVTAENVAELVRMNTQGDEPSGDDGDGESGNKEWEPDEEKGQGGGALGELKNCDGEPPEEAEKNNTTDDFSCMEDKGQRNENKRRIKRDIVTVLMLALIPVTALGGMYLLDDRKYYFISVLIVIYTMIPFFLLFERNRPQAREIIVTAVMISLAVAGRAAFFMLPSFKPVSAIVIISGLCLGPQAGFLVGAMSAFVSNFMFGQGPWTPWQMCAFGLMGFIAGLLGRKTDLKNRRIPLLIFGGFMASIMYGGIVDIWTIFASYPEPSLAVAATVYTLAMPFNIIHGIATMVFLYFLAKPIIGKLERIKIKYGLIS